MSEIYNTFGFSIIPEDEEERLLKLREYEKAEQWSDGTFQDIATMMAHVFQVPIALVTLVESEVVSIKANVGLAGTEKVSRSISLCSLAILHKNGVVFEDAAKEPCLLANPLVAGKFGLRFYAAAPLETPDGFRIGAVCIIDKKPRTISETDQELLRNFAALVMDSLHCVLQA